MIKFFRWLFPKVAQNNNAENEYYEWVVRDLRRSKYCELNEDEEIFIKNLLMKLTQNNLLKGLRLERTSRRDIHVSYNSYPIGRIKLNGRKKWMTVNTSDVQTLKDVTLDSFIEKIDCWISYIKSL